MLPSSRVSSARPLGALPERRRGIGRETDAKQPAIGRRQRPIPSLRTNASSVRARAAPDFVVRRATEEDWWHLSQVHCAAFFPGTPGLLVPLLRLDRVLGIEAGASNELKGRGRFACLVAVRVKGGGEEEGEEGEEGQGEGGTAAAAASLPLSSLLPRRLRGCFEPLEDGATRAGVLGAVCVDAQGCQLPPRKLPLRRNAAVASFVALVSPQQREKTAGGGGGGAGPAAPSPSASSPSASSPPPPLAHPPPPPPPPPSGLRAPPGAVAYLSNLAVSPGARELGVGRALLRAAEREAWGWGCRSVALHVGRSNAVAAGLYLSSGFRAVGGALPLVDPAAAAAAAAAPAAPASASASAAAAAALKKTARQQLAGGPLTLMLKVAPRDVVARRAREAAEAKRSAASSPPPPPPSSSSANSLS